MPNADAPSLQELFATSDDVAERLSDGDGREFVVDATGAPLGALVELLLLRRATPGVMRLRDGSARGHLFRGLLDEPLRFRCQDGLGLFHSAANQHTSSAERVDFCDRALEDFRGAGVPNTAALLLSGAMHELLDNVDEHAGADPACLAGYSVSPGEVSLCVADTGEGVLAGYRRSQLSAYPKDAEDALDWAVLRHRSRTGRSDRGTGFQSVMNAFRSTDASLRVRSDDASLELVQNGFDASTFIRKQGQLVGFVVSVHVRLGKG